MDPPIAIHPNPNLHSNPAPNPAPNAAPWRGLDGGRLRVLRHYTHRLRTTLRLVASLEIVSRTSELARVFGIDFHSVSARPPTGIPSAHLDRS
jgi:hypothetical protein